VREEGEVTVSLFRVGETMTKGYAGGGWLDPDGPTRAEGGRFGGGIGPGIWAEQRGSGLLPLFTERKKKQRSTILNFRRESRDRY
jgi:hypothetical protein